MANEPSIQHKWMKLWALLSSFSAAVIFAFTSFWQLSLVAGACGGLLSTRMKWGAITGCGGTALGWLAYMGISFLTTQSHALLEQVSGIIFGSTSLGGVLIILVILIGALFGTLGGSIGSGIRIILNTRKNR